MAPADSSSSSSVAESCCRASVSSGRPSAPRASSAWAMGSSRSTTRAPIVLSTLRVSACAQTAPNRPVLAPITAAGLPRRGVVATGREIQSSAFLSWPGIEALYSGVATSTASDAAIAASDAVLVATPEYNASIPGQLKNALDWISRPVATTPLRGKPAAVIGASTGLFGAVWAQAETRKVLSTIGARVVDRELPIAQADEALGADGLPLDTDAVQQLSATLDELLESAGAMPLAA